MPTPQTAKNHSKLDTLHHFVLMPLLLLNFIFSFFLYARHHAEHPHITLWWIALSLALLLGSMKMRIYVLRVQDRLIRLEERLRLTALLPASEHASIANFTTGQLIALRFAPDAELPALARRALTETLTPKQIKEAIVTWRPDHLRV